MNDAIRRHLYMGECENWRGVSELSKYVASWESNAEARWSIDEGALESFSYHPGPWQWAEESYPYRLAAPVETYEDIEIVSDDSAPQLPLSVNAYAKAWGLIPLGVKPYRDENLWPTMYELKKRARAGEFGAVITYENRYLVHPDAVKTHIEEMKAEESRSEQSYDSWSATHIVTATPFRVVTLAPTPRVDVNMQCFDCFETWTATHIFREVCRKCLNSNVAEFDEYPLCKTAHEINQWSVRYPYNCRATIDGYCGNHRRMIEIEKLTNKGMTYGEAVADLRRRKVSFRAT